MLSTPKTLKKSGGLIWRAGMMRGMERIELRVVIVDDNRDTAAALGRLIETAGFSVSGEIYDATIAFDCIAREKPHVALLDIAMPLIDGCTLAERVRKLIVPAPLLVAVSGFGTPSDKQQAIDAGFNFHLTKPVEWAMLEELLMRHI